MKIGIGSPLAGLIANAPMNTPVFSRDSAVRSTSVLPAANFRYAETASRGDGCPPVQASFVPSGQASATSASTSSCSGAITM